MAGSPLCGAKTGSCRAGAFAPSKRDRQHPRQTLSTMARAFRSDLRTDSRVSDGARALARPLTRTLASAASVRWRRLRLAARLSRGDRAIRPGGLMGRVRILVVEPWGANVEGVALG